MMLSFILTKYSGVFHSIKDLAIFSKALLVPFLVTLYKKTAYFQVRALVRLKNKLTRVLKHQQITTTKIGYIFFS